MSPPRLTVVVPALREEGRIGETVAALRAALTPATAPAGVEIVVVDDGSGDGTSDEARQAGADQVITFDANRGKGAAVRAGVMAATGRTIAFTDADLAYAPDHILRLLEVVEAGADMVVGSRQHAHTTTLVRAGRLREVSGRVFSVVARVVVRVRHRDTQCGLKAFSASSARLLFDRARVDGFAFDVELFHLADRLGLDVREVPVELASSPTSTVRIGPDARTMVRDLFRIRRWGRDGSYERGTPADRSPGRQ